MAPFVAARSIGTAARASLRSLFALGCSAARPWSSPATVDRPGSSRPAVEWAPGRILSPSPPSPGTRGAHRASSGVAPDVGHRDTGVHAAGRASSGLAAAEAGTVVSGRLQEGVPTPFLPCTRWLAGVSGRRSLSSSTPSGGGRLVRDGSGRFVRVATGGDRGDDGPGKKRVRDSNNANGGGGGGSSWGGRGGGRRRGRDGDKGGGRGDAIKLINASIKHAACPQDIFSIVGDHHRLDHIHVSTAFNKLGVMAKRQDLSPRRLTADADFQKLLGLAHALAKKSKFGSHSVANTTHGIAKLHEAGRLDATDGSVDATLVALEGEAVRVARDMNSQAVANTLYAYGSMGRMPGMKPWAALETAAMRVARDMNSQEVANTLWSYATLKRTPGVETWAALETAVLRVAREMKPQNVANTLWSYATLKRTPGDETWPALETAAVRVARDMIPQNVANTLWSYATLKRTPEDETWAALETAAVRVAREMNSQDVTNTLWSYATLKSTPGDETWAALETAAVRVARDMIPQNAANTLWSYATLKRMPEDETWAALETAAVRVARDMNSQDVADTLWSYATLKSTPGDEMWAALETAVLRVARDMNSQDVAKTLWSYATRKRMPGDKMWAVLETAAGRVAREMNSQDVANTLWSYSRLKRMPEDETWAALETAAVRVARDMNSQDVANTVFAYATLSILHDVAHPSCYAALWKLVYRLEAQDFSDESLCMLFHVHLMHHSASRSVTVACPAWVMVEARYAWMRQVEDDVTVSRGQRSLARVFDELGVRHEVERRTDDGYFSMDIYLPEYDVAVEFDGPTHYYHTSESSSTWRDASTTTRTAKTELRDFFLAKQCAKVVTVPWFEFAAVEGSPKKRGLYIKDKLAKEAGVEV